MVSKWSAIYVAVVSTAVGFQYFIELVGKYKAPLDASILLSWLVHALVYVVLGVVAGLALQRQSTILRLPLLSLIGIIPHVIYELTHGSDPAYPYIGLFFIVPDLLAVGIGAVLSSAIASRSAGSHTS